MTLQAALDEHFPGTLTSEDFVRRTASALEPFGFTRSAFACVGTCRDELCGPFEDHVTDAFGEAFNFSSLAGVLTLGKTGFGAAHAHAPIEDGIERYVYYVMTHIAIGPNGEIGLCTRDGRPGTSGACGALMHFHGSLEAKTTMSELDMDDIEQSLLHQRLGAVFAGEPTPTLVEVTKAAHDLIAKDLRRTIGATVDTKKAHYAAFTGIQVHTPDGQPERIWSGERFIVIDGEEKTLDAI